MRNWELNLPFVSSLNLPFKIGKQNKEIIDFKTFCSGGSPGYIRAKKIINELGFLKSENAKLRSLKAYSLYINPLAFIDVHFILIGVSIVLVAVIEKALAQSGMINIAAVLSAVLRFSFPVVAFGSVIYLILHSGFLF